MGRGTAAAALEGLEEIHGARLKVVHRARHFDRALRFQFSEDGAVLSDSGHSQLDVLSGDRVDEAIVLRRTLASIGGGVYRGFDVRQQSRQIAQLGIVDGPLDGAARGVAHYKYHFCA